MFKYIPGTNQYLAMRIKETTGAFDGVSN